MPSYHDFKFNGLSWLLPVGLELAQMCQDGRTLPGALGIINNYLVDSLRCLAVLRQPELRLLKIQAKYRNECHLP